MKARSPIRQSCRKPIMGVKVCAWRCVAPVAAAEFVSRTDPRQFAVVHPSTKRPGMWQVSWFDDHGASRDVQAKTCDEALSHVPPRGRYGWRLRSVVRRP